jgi:hypothetical protein
MMGPGKYDDLCKLVRKRTKASGTVVIVFGGSKGHGFSCQCDLLTMTILPDILEQVARQMRADIAGQEQTEQRSRE